MVCFIFRLKVSTATCKSGCANGGCNFPGECYCNTGYSGPTCSSSTIGSGIGTCVYPNVTSTCKLANGQLREDCPAGYTRLATEACPDIPGFDRNICGKTCCDGWTGPTCATRLPLLLNSTNHDLMSCLAVCVGDCSGHGVCTAAATCSCNLGWMGATCSIGLS